jgi:hypothetical protein
LKKEGITLAASLLTLTILAFSATFPAQADQPLMEEGATLYYKWARIGQGAGGKQTGDATFKILVANQTTIVARATGTTTMDITIKYKDGFPIYADYLEALIYLPQTCITQTLQGNLNWITKMETSATIANATAQPQQFTVDAGTFQSLNITLHALLKGAWQYGNLTLIYDINSGILIYEQWIPEYGDIIIQSLSSVTQAPKPQNVMYSMILTAATFVTPTVLAIHKTREALKKRKLKSRQAQASEVKIEGAFPKKPFYTILAGATLSLASTLLPWSQLAETQMYLPLSLQTTLTAQKTLIPTTISLTAHTATILAWIAIATSLYTKMKRTPQIIALISSILAFTSAATLIQSGLKPSWGAPIITISGILTILGLTATNVKTTTEKKEEHEDVTKQI